MPPVFAAIDSVGFSKLKVYFCDGVADAQAIAAVDRRGPAATAGRAEARARDTGSCHGGPLAIADVAQLVADALAQHEYKGSNGYHEDRSGQSDARRWLGRKQRPLAKCHLR